MGESRSGITRALSKIPPDWRRAIVLWAASFLIGIVTTLIWGVTTLLTVLIIAYAVALLCRLTKIAQWAMKQFWGHIRGMTISAMLPGLFQIVKNMVTSFSLDAFIQLMVMLFLIAFIYFKFDDIIKDSLGRKSK